MKGLKWIWQEIQKMKTSFKFTAFTLSELLPHPNPTPLQIRVKVFHMQNSQVDYVIFAFIFINLRLS